MVQIAGLIARRILCTLREGDAVRAGARFGIIRFGSRTDLYLPEGVGRWSSRARRCSVAKPLLRSLGRDRAGPRHSGPLHWSARMRRAATG